MTLQRRLMLTLTGVTATVLIASFLTVFLLVRRDELLALDDALFLQAHVVLQELDGRNASQIVLAEGTAEVPESLSPTTRFIAIYDAAGEPIVSSRSFGGDAPGLHDLGFEPGDVRWEDRVSTDLDVRDHRLRGVLVPLGQREESLLYAASRRTITEDTHFLIRMLSVLLIASIVGTALVARWLGKLLARDVQAIAGVARLVTHGDLEARVGSQARGSIETRLLAADLDDMIERLGALVQAQRDFIAHAAHELRSPLTTLRGELQLALRRPRGPEEYRQAVQEVLEDVENLTRLADDLLALARIQSQRPTTLERSALTDVVEMAVSMARGAAEHKEVTIEVLGAPTASDVFVVGARGELARALRNVLDNAIHHSPTGHVVTIGHGVVAGRVEVAVTDQGHGVPLAERAKIFAPFFRGSATGGDHPGAGLGLSIARGIIEGLGGTITLDPSHEPGAKFVLSLPPSPPEATTQVG
jgi:two-component system, OmpR family, sensor kinase